MPLPNNVTPASSDGAQAWRKIASWFLAGLAVAVAVAWLAVKLQQTGVAPVGLLSLVVGGSLGVAWAALARRTEMGSRPAAMIGGALLAMACVALQHGLLYMAHRAERTELHSDPQLGLAAAASALVQPLSPIAYFRSQATTGRALLWSADAVLTVIAALIPLAIAFQRPYCLTCSSWYRTTLRRHLLPDEAEGLPRVLPELPPAFGTKQISMQLEACGAGCRPRRLRLSWKLEGGRTESMSFWLNHEQQQHLADHLAS